MVPKFDLDPNLEYDYKGKVSEDKKAITQDLRIIESEESEEEEKKGGAKSKDLKKFKPDENFN